MKKILLGIFAASLATGAFAQNVVTGVTPKPQVKAPAGTVQIKKNNEGRQTRALSRWYDPLEAALLYHNGDTSGLASNQQYAVMWPDTTMLVRYSNGAVGGAWMKSMAQILHPQSGRFNNATKLPAYAGQMALSFFDNYTVDSVAVAGYYVRNPQKANVTDSLIIHVGYGNLSGGTSAIGASYVIHAGNSSFIVGCYGIDTMRIGALDYNFQSGGLKGSNVVRKAIPLKVGDSGGAYFYTPVNLNVPAGNLVAMSIDFKPGTTWIPNVDSIDDFNYFMPLANEENAGAIQNYVKGDFNSTYTLEGDTTGWGGSYIPNYLYIGAQPPCVTTFRREQYWTLFKLSCATCNVGVGIENLAVQAKISLLPNPVQNNAELNLEVTKTVNNATAEIYSITGQLLQTVSLGSLTPGNIAKKNLDLSSLPAGMYIATIDLDGHRISNRFAKN